MAKKKLPIVGGLYLFTWPKKKPTMRAIGRVRIVDSKPDVTDVHIDMGEKGMHKIILDQANFEVAHPDEPMGIQMKMK